MKVYVAMPINGAQDDFVHRFDVVADRLSQVGMEPVLPVDEESPARWAQRLQEKPFAEAAAEIVQHDLSCIRESHAVLAFMTQPSIGTAMEIAYAVQWGLPVVVVTSLQTLYHPWLWFHADKVIWSTDPYGEGLARAIDALRAVAESRQRPRLYLSGGLHSGWQDKVIESLGELYQIVDPRQYQHLDRNTCAMRERISLENSRYLLAYLEDSNKCPLGLFAELGLASALPHRPRIVLVADKGWLNNPKQGWLYGFVEPKRVYGTLDEAIEYLREERR